MYSSVIATLILAAMPITSSGARLSVEVRSGTGAGVDEAVVYAIPDGQRVPPPTGGATMDQYNRMFVPHVLAVQTGTAVNFPNSDNVRHQVYSFSAPKKFQIPLYEGMPPSPVVLDKPGILSLGCNIHDRMSAFIVVVDTPYFGTTEQGRVDLQDLPAGTYAVYVWHAGKSREPKPQAVTLGASDHLELVLTTEK